MPSLIRFAQAAILAAFLLPAVAHSQTNFPTPNSQNVPAQALLVPCGTLVNGQPAFCPPGQANGLAVVCVNCSPSAPVGVSSAPINGTIAVTSTWQKIAAANPARRGCSFWNKTTDTWQVYFGAAPTNSGGVPWYAGAQIACTTASNAVLTDDIWLFGPAGDAFAGFVQ